MKHLRTSLTAALLVCAAVLPQASAEQLRSSFDCLPAETVLTARMPSGKKTLEHLRAHTKLGSVVLSNERWQKTLNMLQTEHEDDWAQMEDDLAQVGLEVDDFKHLFDGEIGYALLLEKRDDEFGPMLIGIAWANPGEQRAAKFVAALGKATELAAEEEDEDRPKPRRTDIEVAGHEVMHLAVPEVDIDWKWDDDDFDMDGFEEGFSTGLKAAGEKLVRTVSAAADDNRYEVYQSDQTNVFVTRMGGRVILMHTFPMNEGRYFVAEEEEKEIDFDEVSGVKNATAVLARFLQAHTGGANEPYVAKLLATPGLADAMPEGDTILEAYGDPKPLFTLLSETADAAEVKQTLEKLGLDGLGPIAMRWSMRGNMMESGAFVSAPAPRRGVLTLLEQPKVKPGVPAWVPATAFDYNLISFDLAGAWTLAKKLAVDIGGQGIATNIEMAEAQVQNFAQTDLSTLLTGLGTRHTILRLEPIGERDGERMSEGNLTRFAFIWQLQNQPAWETLLNNIAPFTAMTEGMIQPAEEQGFKGYRLNPPFDEGPEGSLMIGKGYLALSIGNEVTEEVLNALRNPPAGEAALVNTDGYKRYLEIFKPKPGFSQQFYNLDHFVGILYDALMMQVEDDLVDDEFEQIMELLPTREEMKGAFGVGGSYTYVNEHGLVGKGIVELPKAEE